MASENAHQPYRFTRQAAGYVRTRFSLHEDEADLIEAAARATRTPVLSYMMRSVKQRAIDDLTELGEDVPELYVPADRNPMNPLLTRNQVNANHRNQQET